MKPLLPLLFLAALAIPYWIGVFSGAWAKHGPYFNSDPDAWIHGGIFAITNFFVALAVIKLRDWRKARKLLRKAKALSLLSVIVLLLAALAGAQGGGVQQPRNGLIFSDHNTYSGCYHASVREGWKCIGGARPQLWMMMPLVEPLPPPSRYNAVLIEAEWIMEKSPFASMVPCDPPTPTGSAVVCSKPEYYETWKCPKSAVAAFPLETNVFFNWAAYHKRGGKVWCLTP